jgi:hypothetical protein
VIDEQLARLEATLASSPLDDRARGLMEARLRLFNTRLRAILTNSAEPAGDRQPADTDVAGATDEELVALVERELGSS